MPHQRKKRRKYYVKDDSFIKYVVSSLKGIPPDEVRRNLDDYERAAVASPAQWARQADLTEILAICAKVGIKLTLIGMDERTPLKAFEISKATKEFYRRKDVNALLEIAAKHKFFAVSGATIMKNLGMYSQLLNGSIYTPNKDYGTFLKIGKGEEDQSRSYFKNVDNVIGLAFILNGIDELTMDDLAILYLVRKYDSMPLSARAIYETLEYRRSYERVRRHLAKLTKARYLVKYGIKNNSMYSLTEKGWGLLNKARKAFFEDAKFWNASQS